MELYSLEGPQLDGLQATISLDHTVLYGLVLASLKMNKILRTVQVRTNQTIHENCLVTAN